MTGERMARPVSGEIMSGSTPGSARAPRTGGDIVDAEYETVSAASSAQPHPKMPQATEPSAPARGMDILREDKAAGKAVTGRRAGPAFWIFGLALVAGAFWVSGGHALVSRPAPVLPVQPDAVPQPREVLRIVDVASRIEHSGNRTFLLVDGEVVNTGRRSLPLPSLDIRVADDSGRVTRYMLGTGERRLVPGGRFPFSGRLEAPASGVGTVTVDFSEEVK